MHQIKCNDSDNNDGRLMSNMSDMSDMSVYNGIVDGEGKELNQSTRPVNRTTDRSTMKTVCPSTSCSVTATAC